MSLPAHPFDDDKLREECGVFGIIGVQEAANFVALGLHALQHRGQEAAGIVAYEPQEGFSSARRFGYVRDNFTSASLMETLPGSLAIGHVRYSTAGSKGNTQIRDVQPLFAEFAMGGAAIAHNGNLTNALALARGADRARLDLPVGLRHRVHHPPDGALDPEHHPRADEGRAAPGRGRLLDRRDDPLEADRRARRARRAPADARPARRRLGAVVGDLRARHHRRRVRARGRAGRDGDLHPRRRRELPPVRAAASRGPASSSASTSRAPTASSAAIRSTRPAAASAPSSPARRRSRPTSSARCPTAAPPPPSATARRAGSPTRWGSSATSTSAGPSSSRPTRSATWACG